MRRIGEAMTPAQIRELAECRKDDNYAELVSRLQGLAPRVDDITGPSSVVEIAAAKALREAATLIDQQSARLQELERDAARWQFLLSEHNRGDPVLNIVCKVHYNRNSSEWCNIYDLNKTVDAALAADAKGAKP